jgi:hypothetical protein
MAGLNMEDGKEPAKSLRQHAATYVDELIRIAPPCDHPLTPEMRADSIDLVESAMQDLTRGRTA